MQGRVAIDAIDLLSGLQFLVEPGTWKTQDDDQLPGTIVQIASSPDTTAGLSDALAARATLIVTHTRATHEKIEKAIGRIQNGDRPAPMPGGMGGGFGGGLPADASPSAPSGGMGGGFGGF